MADPPRVAVVGGGIAGLATTWYLTRDRRAQVTLLEAGSRAGGKIRTEEVSGTPVEGGPDTFLARVPWAVDLCRELGLGNDLVAPATGKAYVWARGRLRPFPDGLVLGVPTTFAPLLRSGIVSPAGAARAALDLVLPHHPFPEEDPSVADVVRSRMGPEVLDRLVDPLIGGINAGSSEGLSLRATAPQLAEALDGHRSLALGLRHRRPSREAGPVFLGLKGGMERLVDRLRESLSGVELRTSTRVERLRPLPGGRHHVGCEPGPDVTADAVVVATPAYAAAGLLDAAANDLRRIEYASVVVTTLGYRPGAVRHDLDGSGFLVPRSEGWLTTACTWATSKWPELRRTGLTLLRASSGRAGDERAMALDDDTLVDHLHGELDGVLGLSDRPATVLVTRWPRAFPQYEPGHEGRVATIERSLPPGVFVTGAAYRGLGIAACIREAQATAKRVESFLSPQRP